MPPYNMGMLYPQVSNGAFNIEGPQGGYDD